MRLIGNAIALCSIFLIFAMLKAPASASDNEELRSCSNRKISHLRQSQNRRPPCYLCPMLAYNPQMSQSAVIVIVVSQEGAICKKLTFEFSALWIDCAFLGQFREDDVSAVVLSTSMDARNDIVLFTSEEGLADEVVFRMACEHELIAACVDVSPLTIFVNLRWRSWKREEILAIAYRHSRLRKLTSHCRSGYSSKK